MNCQLQTNPNLWSRLNIHQAIKPELDFIEYTFKTWKQLIMSSTNAFILTSTQFDKPGLSKTKQSHKGAHKGDGGELDPSDVDQGATWTMGGSTAGVQEGEGRSRHIQTAPRRPPPSEGLNTPTVRQVEILERGGPSFSGAGAGRHHMTPTRYA